jgi:NAD(P)-dependent dehydrogenase (short-subunit alcohol dehydrogenase family)
MTDKIQGLRGHALVTGASSGIGAAIASRLLHDGWRVTGLDRAEQTIQSPRFSSLTLDLLDAGAVRGALDGLEVSALVHAAGFMRVGELGSLDLAAGTDMWRVNVAAAMLLADMLAPRLPRGGRIVLIGSRTAAGASGRSQYVATKSALIGMARSWAMELAPRGITVNVVSPSATETPMLLDPGRSSVPPRLPPIGRFVRPEEVAAATAFLLSEEAASITGQQLVICGGSSL